MQQRKKIFPVMSMVYLVIYLVAIIYNIEHHQKLLFICGQLVLGNLAYIIYSLVKSFHKFNE